MGVIRRLKTQKVANKTDGHCNLQTESAQRADSVKILRETLNLSTCVDGSTNTKKEKNKNHVSHVMCYLSAVTSHHSMQLQLL